MKLARNFTSNRSKIVFTACISMCMIVAGAVIIQAAPTFAKYEAETGTTVSPTAIVNDSTAAAGKAVQFNAVSTGGGPTGKRCVVSMHGRGGAGNNAVFDENGYTIIYPNGNEGSDNSYTWIYFPDSGYNQVRTIVANAISSQSCGQVIVQGFSNGGGAVGKLYCRGETFGGKMIGYIADDPVQDHGVDNCLRPAGIKIRFYSSGDIDWPAGTS